MKKFLILLLALISIPHLALAESHPVKVVATFSIIGDLAQQIGGDAVEITTLVGPDGDTHTYKPTPKDLKTLASADLLIENGLGLEGWITRLATASGFKGTTIIASTGIPPRTTTTRATGTDPHAWQDVANTRLYVKNITEALIAARPERAGAIKTRAAAYDDELKKLDAWMKSEFAAIPAAQRKIITSHDAFGYFGAAYGVIFLAPQTLSTENEPTATQVARLVEIMQKENIKLVFFENMTNPKLIQQLAKDAGATVGKSIFSDALSPATGPAATYIAMMRHNTAQFKEAMLQNGMLVGRKTP